MKDVAKGKPRAPGNYGSLRRSAPCGFLVKVRFHLAIQR